MIDRSAVDRVLAANRYPVLGTADEDGQPWVTPLFFAPLDPNRVCWVSSPDSRHSRNIAHRAAVAITVFDSTVEAGAGGGGVLRRRGRAGDPGRDGHDSQIFDELNATGAIVAGAGTFEPAGGWGGDHHDGVPIFIYSRHEPRIDTSGWPLVTYVTDVVTAMADAKQAAGDKDVSVHGAAVAQLALKAAVLDELELHVVPVLLGQGRRLFDGLDPEHIERERVRVLEGEHGVTHLRYRVRRPRGA